MQPLRHWSFVRVALACIVWVACCLAAIAIWLFVTFRAAFDHSVGSGGIGAVSIGINALVLLVPVAPPMVLIAAWSILRRSRRGAR